ncbi:MAG: hypothetical protein QOF28_2807 [Actinomycetota bacterium]|nr:hypothetical protein [Actinomycetota bacterium]
MRATTLVDVSSAAARPRPTRLHAGLLIWVLLFFNGLAFNDIPLLIPIPAGVGKIATQGALALAVVLVLAFNRARLTRPNLFLSLFTLLALSSLMMSVRVVNGPGTLFRAGRLSAFIGVLWLLSPLFGRADRVLLKWHVTCLVAVLSTVVVGYLIAPGRATQMDGRLAGQIWPIPPTQVGHYSAVLAGVIIILGLCGMVRGRTATLLGIGAVAVLLLCHTRTALIALIVAVVCAMLSLLTVRRRVRQAAAIVFLAAVLGATVLAPAVRTWYTRGQPPELVGQLNGRKGVWDELMRAPRSRLSQTFGIGLTNKSFNGLPIDNSWLATYQDQGLFGVGICAAIIISLLLFATTRPRGPNVAVAVFLVVYCTIASFSETGLGDASPYVLDLAVAASLLAVPRGAVARGVSEP